MRRKSGGLLAASVGQATRAGATPVKVAFLLGRADVEAGHVVAAVPTLAELPGHRPVLLPSMTVDLLLLCNRACCRQRGLCTAFSIRGHGRRTRPPISSCDET